MAAGAHALSVRKGHLFRAAECNQAAIIFDELIGIGRAESPGVEQEVFLNLLAHHLGQNQLCNARCAQRENRFIQPPCRNDAAGQDVGVQEEANPPWARHGWTRFPDCLRPFRFAIRAP